MNNYDLIKMIGQGSYGDVNLVSCHNDPKLYVMKVIRNANEEEGKEAMKEVNILETLDHPNIVKLKECFYQNSGKTLCIVMEYAESGDLYQQIQKAQKKRQYISQSDILDWFVQLCLALKYLHEEKHILHRDLKPANVFLAHRARVLKLGDFGITKVLENTRAQAVTTIGTPYYFSPEICQNQPYGVKSDVWATGCIVYELMTLCVPFEAKSMAKLVQNILHQKPASPNSRYYSKDFMSLLAAMLAKGPSRRPTVAQCLQTPVVRAHMAGFRERFAKFYAAPAAAAAAPAAAPAAPAANGGGGPTPRQAGGGGGGGGGGPSEQLVRERERLVAGRRDRGRALLAAQAARAAPRAADDFELEADMEGDNAAAPPADGAEASAPAPAAGAGAGAAPSAGVEVQAAPAAIEEDPDLEKTAIALHSAHMATQEQQLHATLMETVMAEIEKEMAAVEPGIPAEAGQGEEEEEGYDGEVQPDHYEAPAEKGGGAGGACCSGAVAAAEDGPPAAAGGGEGEGGAPSPKAAAAATAAGLPRDGAAASTASLEEGAERRVGPAEVVHSGHHESEVCALM